MGRVQEVCSGVWMVAGPGLTAPGDCQCYLVDLGDLLLVDCGLGPGWERLAENIRAAGFEPGSLHTLLLTHGHVDHVGAAAAVRRDTGCRVVMHEEDAWVLERGDPRASAASWYGTGLVSCAVDLTISGPMEQLVFSRGSLDVVHIPGHTPGSVAAFLDRDGLTILFGQDIHGPFHPDFGSDLEAWRESMGRLLERRPDVLCEGHFGVIRPAEAAEAFIREQLASHGFG